VFLNVAFCFINDEVFILLGEYLFSICPEPPHEERVPELDIGL